MAFQYYFYPSNGGCRIESDNANFNKIIRTPASVKWGFDYIDIVGEEINLRIPKASVGYVSGYTVQEGDTIEFIAGLIANSLPTQNGTYWTIAADFYITVGGTPADGDTSYANPALLGATSETCKVYVDSQALVYGDHFNLEGVEGGGVFMVNGNTFLLGQHITIWLKS